MKSSKVTALVPMKGNSERVPNKNIRLLNGKPVCHWIIEALSKSKYVDEIIPYLHETDLEDILQMRQFNVRILGEEYRHKEFTGRDICKARDIELYFNRRDHRFSSSGLRERISNAKSK